MARKNIRTRSRKQRAEALIREHNLAEARTLYKQICQIDRLDSEAWLQLATINRLLGHFKEAEQCCRHVLKFEPGRSSTFHILGMTLEAEGKLDEAMAAYKKVLQLNPDAVEAYNNLGNVLAFQKKPAEAIEYYQHVLRLKPDTAEAYNNLGHALRALGRSAEAEKFFRKTIQLWPNSFSAHSNLLLCLNYIPTHEPELLFKEHIQCAEKHTSGISTFPTYPNEANVERRLRIGYVSPDLHKHPAACFIEPILAHHDSDRFEIICYAEVSCPDAVTARFQNMADKWRTTCGMTDAQVATMIQGDAIDILVDLAGHTSNNRLLVFARKPAPIQVTYLGYPNTTGLSMIDYCITDIVADPPGADLYYTEKLIRLEGGFSCYQPPDDASPITPLPARDKEIVTFGSLNMLGKIDEEVIKVWCNVLRAHPASRMLIFRDELRGKVKDQYHQAFAAQGINGNRVELLNELPPGKSHLDVYEQIDIALDTFPWNGHTTSCEALWMGIPVITLYGKSHAGRLCASILHQLGLSQLVAKTPNEYVSVAINLAANIDKLEILRSSLRQTMASSPLCDGKTFTKALEKSYHHMWEQWCLSIRK